MKHLRLFKILVSFIIIFSLCGCSNDTDETVDSVQYECKVDTISFLSDSTKTISDEVEVVFAVSLEGETQFFTVLEKYNTINGLITIGDKLIHVNDFSTKGDKATFDFYYGENLGPFCLDVFSAIPMHSHDAFNAEADRVDSSKNVGKWKVKKIRVLRSNDPPN
ncbi:MAG: hypothetical protein CBD07_002525 [Flavobacteriaceae bacterium TMED147]|nr:MAG: hypothetical protein CBD07_002525 [Flavobacteriaceae bacterium TMED147]RPH00564.1 MAG: hypothetical protein CBD81_002845 [bacterium TMED221]|tara:strand:+ start:30 stop:521 length:492 start_codon:yes stop_codon:yes gene_type:complete